MKRTPLVDLGIALALLVVALGGYWLGYRHEETLRTESLALAGTLAEREAEAARVAAAAAALGPLAADEEAMRAYLVRTDEIVPFLEELEATGAATGATVEVVSVADAPEGERPYLQLALAVTGSFDAVLRALGAIEYGPYDSRIQTLTISGGEEGGWTASATLRFGTVPVPAP